jgi:hypothetical protein
MAFLRYPSQRDADGSILAALRQVFRPALDEEAEFPVSGVAVASDAVWVLLSRPGLKFDQDRFEDLFGLPFVPVKTMVVGHFELCAAPGDTIGCEPSVSEHGTLGCVATDFGGSEFLLSCNHVLADENNKPIGGSVWISDTGNLTTKPSAVLHDFEPIKFGGVEANYMDVAIARPLPGVRTYRSIPAGIGVVGGTDVNAPYGAAVRKYGMASGLTSGVVTFKDMSMKIDYRSGTAVFVNQYGVMAENGFFVDRGDSGSLVVNMRNEAVGMLFSRASAMNGALGIVSPIAAILTRFGLSF